MTTLSEADYYSDHSYMSVSWIKKFIGCPAKEGCEAEALAELRGEYTPPASDALLIGSFIDVQLTGTEDEYIEFVEDHPEMFSSRGPTKGQLKAQYQQAAAMVARIKQDADNGGIFLRTLKGDHQKVFTGEINGFPFKAKLDCLGDGYITDLKTTESINKRYYSNGWWNFIDHWGYPLQGAVYQELVRQNTGEKLPFFIAAVSKERTPDIGVFQIPQESLDAAMEIITPEVLQRIQDLKDGKIEPHRCGHCDYCRSTKVVLKPIDYHMIGAETNE